MSLSQLARAPGVYCLCAGLVPQLVPQLMSLHRLTAHAQHSWLRRLACSSASVWGSMSGSRPARPGRAAAATLCAWIRATSWTLAAGQAVLSCMLYLGLAGSCSWPRLRLCISQGGGGEAVLAAAAARAWTSAFPHMQPLRQALAACVRTAASRPVCPCTRMCLFAGDLCAHA